MIAHLRAQVSDLIDRLEDGDRRQTGTDSRLLLEQRANTGRRWYESFEPVEGVAQWSPHLQCAEIIEQSRRRRPTDPGSMIWPASWLQLHLSDDDCLVVVYISPAHRHYRKPRPEDPICQCNIGLYHPPALELSYNLRLPQ